MPMPCKTSLFRHVITATLIASCAAFGRCETTDGGAPNARPKKTGGRLVGVACVCWPPDASQDKMEELIDLAAKDRPDIILLTEGFMQNAPRSASAEEKDARADPLPAPGPITKFLARKAKQHNAYVVGSYWRRNLDGPGRFNSAVLFDRQGNVAGWYDKMFPTIGEMESGVLPGRKAAVFDADFGRIGVMICFDLNFPELAAEYEKQGVELLCFLSAFRGGRLIPSLAMKNRCYVASAIWKEGGEIVDPLGQMLVESDRNAPVIFSPINLDGRVIHVDYNRERVRRMKDEYGPLVKIESASREALFRISSLHPEKSIDDLMREFEIEDYNAYLDRSRRKRMDEIRRE